MMSGSQNFLKCNTPSCSCLPVVTLQLFLSCVLCSSPSFYSSWPLIFSTFFQRKLLVFFCCFFYVLLFYVYLPVLICFFACQSNVYKHCCLFYSILYASTTHKNITLVSTGASVLWGYLVNRKWKSRSFFHLIWKWQALSQVFLAPLDMVKLCSFRPAKDLHS